MMDDRCDRVTGLYAARWDEDAGAVSHPEHWGGERLGDQRHRPGTAGGAVLARRRGFVTGACGSPRFDRPGVSAEAQALHVFAAVAAAASDPGGPGRV